MSRSMPNPDDRPISLNTALDRLIHTLTSLRNTLEGLSSPPSTADPLTPHQTRLLASIHALQSGADLFLETLVTPPPALIVHEPGTDRTESETTQESAVLRVLIGDPDPANLERLTGWIQDAGHLVWPCISFDDALQKASTRPFNLIILDDRLPRFDRRRISGTLASRDGKDAVNLVLITAVPETYPGLACLTPPVSPDDLDQTLRRCPAQP